jgi:hypothetical protein
MVRRDIEPILKLARELPADDLPQLIGELAEVNAVALARLTAPNVEAKPDANVGVREAARRLGVSISYLYKNHGRYRFARHEGGRLLFSASGLERHLKQSK